METHHESDVDGSLSGGENEHDLSEEEDEDSRLSSNSRPDVHPMLKPTIDPEMLARLKQHGALSGYGAEELEKSLPFFLGVGAPHFMASHLAAAAAAAKGRDLIMDQDSVLSRIKHERSPPLRGYPEESLGANHQAPASNSSTSSTSSQQTWSFEEQFKQLYELSDDAHRKEFLDELFSFMQKRGTPINRLPIMAKQVLDLYELYNLVIARGGLVDVINKKLWQEIIKGLHLPSSITSAAFTLRTQYMKYLYPYECEKKRLSTPAELQAAIDGNRREGRRASYGPYPDMVNNSMISPMSLVGGRPHQMNGNGNPHSLLSTSPNSPPLSASQPSARDALAALELSRLTLWNMYAGGQGVAGLPQVPGPILDPKAPPTQQEALDLGVPTRNSEGAHTPKPQPPIDSSPKSHKSIYQSDRLERENGSGGKRSEHHHHSHHHVSNNNNNTSLNNNNHHHSGPPPPKRLAIDESISPVSRGGTHIKINSRGDGRGMDSSLTVSMEINGIMYQGVLEAQTQTQQSAGRVSS